MKTIKSYLKILALSIFLFIFSFNNIALSVDIQNKSSNANQSINKKNIYFDKFCYRTAQYKQYYIKAWDGKNPILSGLNNSTKKYELIEFNILTKKYKALIESYYAINHVEISVTGKKLLYTVHDGNLLRTYICDMDAPKSTKKNRT